jgi:hypothetical protein
MNFDYLNALTRNYNNGISRTIDPTSKNYTSRPSFSDYNNQTYKTNNHVYPDRLYK